MSGSFRRLACTATVAAQAVLAPLPAAAAPEPERSVSQLLTDLQQLYRQTEQATESYNGTAEKLKQQRAEVARLDGELSRARLALQGSRTDAGRLARQQYQNSGDLGPYVRLLLARDPQHALDEGHVIGELARERARTVARLTTAEKRRDALARAARKALDTQLTLAGRQREERDDVQRKLRDVERLLAGLTPDQLAAVARLEQQGVTAAQERLTTAGALPADHPASAGGDRAVHYALEQLGKPYRWGAEGPSSYDCSGLTSRAWSHAGTPIPRTSQEQWRRLKRVPLNDLRPGDLVVYFPEATHVAMYVGGGKVVQAPRPGEDVKVSPIASYPVLGAVRPDAAASAASADQAPATEAG
ncbi:NlpC/P60 family protein [Streptomyces sp. 1222.5]|uniref:C40 family peptidase n=1 Tax=unclassified Streptomyces TaxID=2593676 RepID=UPI00089C129F|nr:MULTISPECIES: C40 family peptidase [unclassified Streptomyces]PKW10018.1 NlpC/P60 family protein [Streptomyces sp. 5112.2]SEC18022.1 NlpC/P60 family protein [Streptomyces sp. 1222.5]